MITKVTTFNLFLPSRVYFFDSSIQDVFYFNLSFDISLSLHGHIVAFLRQVRALPQQRVPARHNSLHGL